MFNFCIIDRFLLTNWQISSYDWDKQQSEITDYRFQIYYFKLQCAVKRCCESNRVAVEILREKERRKL